MTLNLHIALMTACVFFSASALAPLPVSAAPLPGKLIDLSNQNSSPRHYYSKIRLIPTANLNNPPCSAALTGMLQVDMKGNLLICNGTIPENVTSPWTENATGQIVFAKEFLTAQVAIGSNSIPSNPPLRRPDLVKFYLAQSQTSSTLNPLLPIDPLTSNQIEFKPTDQNGNVTLEMYTGGTPAGNLRTSSYFNFLVGDRLPLPPAKEWDARIEYYYRSAAVSGLKFIGRRKTLAANANNFPELNLYANGRVDFGSDETSLTALPPLPARHATRKVKVYGNTKTDSIWLVDGGPPAPLRVEYNAAGTGGYYAVYGP